MIIDLQKQRHLLQQTTDLTKNFLNWWHEYEIQYLSLPQRRANELPSGIAMLLNSEPERIIIADLMTLWIKISESGNYHFQLAWLNQSTWWKIEKNSIIFFFLVIGSGLLYFRFSQSALFYFRNGCSATITSRVAKRHCQIIRELPSDNLRLQRR